jgi:hypothetical protein
LVPRKILGAHKKNWGKPLDQAILEGISRLDVKSFMQRYIVVHQSYIDKKKADVITDENLEFLDKIVASKRKLAILTSRSDQEAKHLLQKRSPI